VVHNTALNSSDNLPSYLPHNHHSSDNINWMGGEHSVQHTTDIPSRQRLQFSTSDGLLNIMPFLSLVHINVHRTIDTTSSLSLQTFKQRLQMHLFCHSYPSLTF